MRKVLLINSSRIANLLAEHLLSEGGVGLENICSAMNKNEADLKLDELKQRGEKAVIVISSAIHYGPDKGYGSTIPLIERAKREGHDVVLYTGKRQNEISPDLVETCERLGVPYEHRTPSNAHELYEIVWPYLKA